jgi:acetoin utilization protein AcuB
MDSPVPVMPMLVRSRMTADVITASPNTTLADALSVTRGSRIRHLPIVEDGRLVGLVTDRDLRLAMPPVWAAQHDELQALLHTKTVGEVMVTELISVEPDTPVEDAAALLHTHRIGCVPVLQDGTLVGILTETDLLRAFVELFGAHARSTRIEVRMPHRPGELARVMREIGIEKRVNITGMVVPPIAGEKAVAIMHIQTPEPEAVIESLRNMGYAVGSPALDVDSANLLASPASSTRPRALVEQ